MDKNNSSKRKEKRTESVWAQIFTVNLNVMNQMMARMALCDFVVCGIDRTLIFTQNMVQRVRWKEWTSRREKQRERSKRVTGRDSAKESKTTHKYISHIYYYIWSKMEVHWKTGFKLFWRFDLRFALLSFNFMHSNYLVPFRLDSNILKSIPFYFSWSKDDEKTE